MAEDKPLKPVPLGLTGKWRPAHDGTQLADGDFQTLTNMRYTDAPGIKSISGMTKVNTTALAYPKIKAGYHYRKEMPAESHVLVQAFNSAETASKVYDNKTAVPTAGDFEPTEVFSDTSGAGTGRFSDAPDGCMAYSNGVESCVWGGNEYRVASFINGNLAGTIKYDYTDKVNNNLTDVNNVATLHNVADPSTDPTMMLNLHLNNNVTDSSPTTPHTVTNTNVTFSTSIKKFGTHSASFNGTSSQLSIPDDADFDFSATAWLIEMQYYPSDTTDNQILYYQQTDGSNYMQLRAYRSGSSPLYKLILEFKIVAAASTVVTLLGPVGGLSIAAWNHIALVFDGASGYYLFIQGNLVASTSSASKPANYTGTVYIGSTGAGGYLKGYLDEIAIFNAAKWTSNFIPPVSAYGSGVSSATVLIGSTRPIQGVNFYVVTANASTATASGKYWDGTNYTPVPATWNDGTILTTGKTLSRTGKGSITFGSTVGLAKPKIFDNQYWYWYLFTFSGIDDGVTISQCTVDAPMQPIVDIWDGTPRGVQGFFKLVNGVYSDDTINVFTKDYDSTNTATYSDISSLAASSSLIIGFAQRMAAIMFGFVTGKTNSNGAAMTISYWGGTSWTTVNSIDDQTSSGGKSMTQAGFSSWSPPNEIDEFPQSINGGPSWVYYKLDFSAALSSNVFIDYIFGIPAPKTIQAYAFSANWQNRMVLIGQTKGKKNSILIGGYGSVCVFNGVDTLEKDFGDDSLPTAAGALFTRDSGSFFDTLVICKKTETWILDGIDPQSYHLYKLSDIYGCVAPDTFKIFPVSFSLAPGISRHVAIWQSAVGIVLFDGNTIGLIDEDIRNYFDLNKPECITASLLDQSTAFMDEREQGYHWNFASGSSATTLNTELVFHLRKKGWYKIDRTTTNNQLQCGIPVKSTLGGAYVYGAVDSGYLERLEYGNTFDGEDITSTFKTKDYSIGWSNELEARWVKFIAKAKNSTATAILSAFLDANLTAENKTLSMALASTLRRVVQSTQSCSWGPAAFCAFQGEVISNDIAISFEPIGISLLVKQIREDTRPLIS